MTANRSTGVCETYMMRWHRCRCTDMRWIRFTCERRVSLMEMHPEEMPSCVPVAGMRLVHSFGRSRDFAGKRLSFGRSIRIGCWCSPVMPFFLMPFFLLSSTATAANPIFLCRCGWVLWPVSTREASVKRVRRGCVSATAAFPVIHCRCGWDLWPVSAREASVVRVGAVSGSPAFSPC